MERKKVTQFFLKSGLKLRPKSCEMITENYIFFEKAEGFLTALLEATRKILTEKNDPFNTFVEPEVAEEAIFILRKESNTLGDPQTMQIESLDPAETVQRKGDAILYDHLIVLSNFDGCSLHFDQGSNELHPVTSRFDFDLTPGRGDFEKSKYRFLRHMVEQTGQYYFEHASRDTAHKKTKVSEIGSLKGQEGSFTIFGAVFKQAGEYFVQDLLTSLKISLLHCAPTDGYLTLGCFVLLTGTNHESVFLVDKVIFPDFSNNAKVERHVLFRAAFHQSINQEIQNLTLQAGKETGGRSKPGNAFIRNFGAVLTAKGDEFRVRVANNFLLAPENMKSVEEFILGSDALGVDLLVLSGPFFQQGNPRNSGEKEAVQRSVSRFLEILQKIPNRVSGMMLMFVPDVFDFGLQTFPKRPISESVFGELSRVFPNHHFCENPCHFMVKDKTFLVSKTNLVIKLLRNSVAAVNPQTAPSEHLTRNILGQRDLLPMPTQDYTVPPKAREKLMLYELPDFTIICDDLAGVNLVADPHHKFLVFPGNFSHARNFATIQPFKNRVVFNTD